MPSKPASTASLADCAYSAMARAMSSSVITRGAVWGCMPSESVYISPGQASADGPTHSAPAGRLAACVTRPVCISCTTILPPLACTASVTSFQPATCCALNRPGMRA